MDRLAGDNYDDGTPECSTDRTSFVAQLMRRALSDMVVVTAARTSAAFLYTQLLTFSLTQYLASTHTTQLCLKHAIIPYSSARPYLAEVYGLKLPEMSGKIFG